VAFDNFWELISNLDGAQGKCRHQWSLFGIGIS